MASFNKTSRFLRAPSSTNPKSTKEDGSLSPKGRMTPGDQCHHLRTCQLQLIDLYTLFCLGLIHHYAPAATGLSCRHRASLVHPPRQSSSIPIAFHQASAQGTFPWGDLYWSPYLTLEPCLIHQPHRMNSDRECFSLQTSSQPPHLKLRKKAINRVCFLFVSVASFFTY